MRLDDLTFQPQPHFWPEPPECNCYQCCLEWVLQILSPDSSVYDRLEEMEDPDNDEEPSEFEGECAALIYARCRIEYEINGFAMRNMSADERELLYSEPLGFA